MRGLETTPAIIIYSSIKMMIHIFPGWLDKANAKVQFCNKLFVASASSLQASRSSENEKRVGLTLAGVLCLHLAFTPYSHDDDGSYRSSRLLCLRGQNQSCFVLVKRGAINKHHLCERSPNLPRLSGKY